MAELLFKVLNENARPYHGGCGEWPLPNEKPGKWLKVDGALVPCSNGLHLCTAKQLISWLGPTLWLAQAGKERVAQGDKIVVRRARLLSKVETWDDKTARLFAADCAERALKREEKSGRKVDKRSWDAVRIARDFARGKVSDEERAAAGDAAWAAAGVAAEVAAGAAAGAAARNAAWAAAWAAAWDAAGAAAGVAAGAAARSAAWAVAWNTAGDAARAVAEAAARAAAWDAAWDAARAAARAAAGDAARVAARDAAGAAERKWQAERLMRYLKLEVPA